MDHMAGVGSPNLKRLGAENRLHRAPGNGGCAVTQKDANLGANWRRPEALAAEHRLLFSWLRDKADTDKGVIQRASNGPL